MSYTRDDFRDTVINDFEARQAARQQEQTEDPEALSNPTHAGLAVQAADTGRILLIQRALDQNDPPDVQGTWEFPGGGIEDGEDPEAAARREFMEEVGCEAPAGEMTGQWTSGDGVYRGHVMTTDMERTALGPIDHNSLKADAGKPRPSGRPRDTAAWFSLDQIQNLGTNLRPEVHNTDWSQFSEGGGDHLYAEPEPEEETMATEFKDYTAEQRKKAHTLPDGSFPIEDCEDLKNAIQAIGRAKDPGKAKAHIRSRKSALGCPDVSLPDTWATTTTAFSIEPIAADLEGESYCIHEGCEAQATHVVSSDDPQLFGTYCADHAPEHEDQPLDMVPDALLAADNPPVPWHAVITVEGQWSGDRRRFSEGAITSRPLPLPLTWQRVSADGHSGSPVVGKREQHMRVGNQIRANGHFINNPEADEVIGLISEFGRFGLSVDADNVDMEFSEAGTDREGVTFTAARDCGACIVQIPAFAEAWIALGDPPEDFYDGGTEIGTGGESLVASIEMADLAPGLTEDGPGWLTHPVDTDRLRDYWVRGEGAAKINWGVPGDFDRCRTNLAQYVKPQYLSGYCANRHHDALGMWPGQEASVSDSLSATEAAPVLALVASAYGNMKAPAEWFSKPEVTEFPEGCPLTITEDGQVYGHVAVWNTCHANKAYGECQTAPHSPSGYRAGFLLGGVLLDNDETIACGSLVIGGGHAPGHYKMRRAQRFYDDASTVFADVNVVDGEQGIWVAGWVRPGTPEEMVVAARASKLSGDWRKSPTGEWEMIAALAVNTPGYAIPRMAAGIADGHQVSLVAANVVAGHTEPAPEGFDMEALADVIIDRIAAREQARVDMAALRERFEQKVEVEV